MHLQVSPKPLNPETLNPKPLNPKPLNLKPGLKVEGFFVSGFFSGAHEGLQGFHTGIDRDKTVGFRSEH